MNETRKLILNTAERIFQDLCDQGLVDRAAEGEWPAELWRAIEESGLTLAAVPEECGGVGGDAGDALGMLKIAARSAAPLPLAETIITGHLLAKAGADVPSGPLTVAPLYPRDVVEFSDGTLSGTAARVPWASNASAIIVAVAEGIALVDPANVTITPGQSIAGEPRDTVMFDNADCQFFPAEDLRQELYQLGALTRAVMMAGALETILEMTAQYVQDRVQFGRPLAKFQAIQQSLAVMAGQTTAASSAAGMAVAALEKGDATVEIAVAKARAGEAASIASELAHQAHGAIGFTHEYLLHQYTRRLWCWRDEFGSEPYWQAELGRAVAKAGKDKLWEFATQSIA